MPKAIRVDWKRLPLGQVPDSAIVKMLRKRSILVSVRTVARHRAALGIPRTKPEGIDYAKQPLGKVPDAQIAKKLGVTTASVQQARVRRGIASWLSQNR